MSLGDVGTLVSFVPCPKFQTDDLEDLRRKKKKKKKKKKKEEEEEEEGRRLKPS